MLSLTSLSTRMLLAAAGGQGMAENIFNEMARKGGVGSHVLGAFKYVSAMGLLAAATAAARR